MNKDLFDSMQKQMNPSPEVREALSEKLAQPAKRRLPVRKYVTIAACATLAIGGLSVYSLYQNPEKWMLITQNIHHDAEVLSLHSYVTVEDAAGYAAENTGTLIAENGIEDIYYYTGPIDRDSGAPNTGALPRRDEVIEDVPVQEGAEDYQALMAHFNGVLPDWYGGSYLDDAGRLVVLLVEEENPGDKSMELQIQEWTGSGHVLFSSAKYSLNHLKGLMDRLNRLPDTDLKYADVMAGWGIDEENNRVDLTLTQVYEPILAVLAELDPEDDAIYVQVGRRAAAYAGVEDPALIIPGGVAVRENDGNLIADEPWVDSVDGACYGVEDLPEKLPAKNRPAVVQSVPEEEEPDPLTAVTYDVETGEIAERTYPLSEGSEKNASRSTAPFDPGA